MPQPVPFVDNSHLARNKTPKLRITKRIREAIDTMVARGIAYDAAAREHGIATRHMRLALSKPHVSAYYQAQCQVLRASTTARNIHRLCQIRDAADNLPAVNAIKALEGLAEEPLRTTNAADARGVTIRIINIAQPPPIDIRSAPRVIDAEQ
jgi:hypothetical protein